MRYFLLDRVTELVPGERARGVKNVTLTDEILHDHFPDYPVMPGALLIESAAQLAGYLLEATHNTGEGPVTRAVLVAVDRARFHEPAGPGDQLDVRVTIKSSGPSAGKVAAELFLGERRAARAELTFMMRAIEEPRIHAQRRALYRLWTRGMEPPPSIP